MTQSNRNDTEQAMARVEQMLCDAMDDRMESPESMTMAMARYVASMVNAAPDTYQRDLALAVLSLLRRHAGVFASLIQSTPELEAFNTRATS